MDLAAIQRCVWVVAHAPEVIWPHFGNLRLEVQTEDSEECRAMEASDLSYRVQLGVVNQNLLNSLERVSFEFKFDLIKTPAREKRLLFD